MAEAARLVGRGPELTRLAAVLDDCRRGHPSLVLIRGNAGIGKSRLVSAFLDSADGLRVLRGFCPLQSSTTLAYAPILQALRPLVGSPEIAGLPVHHLDALRPVLPLVDEHGDPQPRWVQTRLFEVLLALLRTLVTRTPVAFVVEDVHWADGATMDLLEFLVVNLSNERFVLIATMRAGEPTPADWAPGVLAALSNATRSETIELSPLDDSAAQELVAQYVGSDRSEHLRIDGLLRRAAGNPLYLEQLALASRSDHSAAFPAPLRDLFAWRMSSVSERARRVVELVSVAGPAVPAESVERMTSLPPEQIDAAVDEASASQLLTHAGGDRLSIYHDLLAEFVYDQIAPGRRARLHRLVAQAHADVVTADRDAAAKLARHWLLGGRPSEAFGPLFSAAQMARQRGLQRDAARLFADLLCIWPTVAGRPAAQGVHYVDLLTWRADSLRWTTEPEAVVSAYREALRAADDLDDVLRRAAVRERCTHALFDAGRSDEALQMAQAACDLVAGRTDITAARCWVTLGAVHMARGEYAAAVPHCEQGMAVAESLGAQRELAHAQRLLGAELANIGQLDRGIAALKSSLRICRAEALVEDQIHTYVNLSYVYERAGLWDEAIASANDGQRLAKQSGLDSSLGVLLVGNEVSSLASSGRWSEAATVAQAPIAAGASPKSRRYLELVLAEIEIEQGHLDVAAQRLVTADGPEWGPNNLGQRCIVDVELARARGDNLGAYTAALASLVEHADSLEPYVCLRLCAAGLRGLAELAGAAGQALLAAQQMPSTPDELLERAKGHVDAVLDLEPCRLLYSLCGLEARRFDSAARADEWRLLAAEHARLGQPHRASYCARRAAELPDDAAPAGPTPARTASITTADPVTRAERLGLTRREREVLRCLASGSSNRRIARELAISEKTASVHVSNILSKLQVRNRAEATAVIHRLALIEP